MSEISRLIKAIGSGKLDDVKRLIEENGINVNATDEKGGTPLHYAVGVGSLEVVEYLIEKGADVNAKTPEGLTPLHLAVFEENLEIIESLLKHGANIDSKMPAGNDEITPLHLAIMHGKLKAAKTLIEHGANVNSKSSKLGYTPLHYAASLGDVKAIQFLLEHSADVNARADYNELTPLYLAVYSGKFEAVRLLIESGADVNQPVKDGWTPLHLAVSRGYHNIMRFLVEHDANVNAKTKQEVTPLHLAVEQNNIKFVKFLVKNGAAVNVKDEYGRTPLHIAVQNENFDIVRFLIAHGANPELSLISITNNPIIREYLSNCRHRPETCIVYKDVDEYEELLDSNIVNHSLSTNKQINSQPKVQVITTEIPEQDFFKKLLNTANGKEFEELLAPLLRLIGINNVYVWRKQRGEPDGFFYIKNLAVIYDATLESNFEIDKKQQIENYVNMLRKPSIEAPKGGVKKKVILGDKDKEIWIITRGSTRLIEDIEGIKVKEVSVNDLIQIYKERLSGLLDEDELVERLKSLGKRRGNSE